MSKKIREVIPWPADMQKDVAFAISHVQGAIDRSGPSTGKSNMILYVKGIRLTARQAILAKCADCCGYYVDGRKDCQCYACPLYQYMPYGIFRKRYVRKDRRAADNDNRN